MTTFDVLVVAATLDRDIRNDANQEDFHAMSSGAKERVLVADDSPQNRTIAIGHLQNAGYEVIAVTSGEEALEVLAREPIDLVVLDVVMPGLGGFETCRPDPRDAGDRGRASVVSDRTRRSRDDRARARCRRRRPA